MITPKKKDKKQSKLRVSYDVAIDTLRPLPSFHVLMDPQQRDLSKYNPAVIHDSPNSFVSKQNESFPLNKNERLIDLNIYCMFSGHAIISPLAKSPSYKSDP